MQHALAPGQSTPPRDALVTLPPTAHIAPTRRRSSESSDDNDLGRGNDDGAALGNGRWVNGVWRHGVDGQEGLATHGAPALHSTPPQHGTTPRPSRVTRHGAAPVTPVASAEGRIPSQQRAHTGVNGRGGVASTGASAGALSHDDDPVDID